MQNYKILGKKGEGTFSEVLRCQSLKTGKLVAIKCMRHTFESLEQVNALREIQALRRLTPHDHIVTLTEVLFDARTGSLGLVFELMDCNIYEHIKSRSSHLSEQEVKGYMHQLLLSVHHMHSHNVFHRDIKPENVLLNLSANRVGNGKYAHQLKLADFGSCRGSHSRRPFTEYISTRWYRAPECLLTDGYYGPEMDIWGIGCVMYEIVMLQPLFPGATEADQIERIHKVLGTPPTVVLEKLRKHGSSHVEWSFATHEPNSEVLNRLKAHVSADGVDLLMQMLHYDMEERITARAALKHKWFADMRGNSEGDPPAPTKLTSAASSSKLPAVRQSGGHAPLSPKPSMAELPATKRSVDVVAAAKAEAVRAALAPQVVPSPSSNTGVMMPITLRFEAGEGGRKLQPLVRPKDVQLEDPTPPAPSAARIVVGKHVLQPIGVPLPLEQSSSSRKLLGEGAAAARAAVGAASNKLPSISHALDGSIGGSGAVLKLAPLNPALVHLQPLSKPGQIVQSSRRTEHAVHVPQISPGASLPVHGGAARLREAVAGLSPTVAVVDTPMSALAAVAVSKLAVPSVQAVAASLAGARKHLVQSSALERGPVAASYARTTVAATVAQDSGTSAASSSVVPAGSYRSYLRKRLEGYVSPYSQVTTAAQQLHSATVPHAAHKAAR